MLTLQELKDGLDGVTTQVAKIGTETTATLQKVADLEAAINNAGNIPDDVQAKFEALKAQVQLVDDLIPDAPAPTPAP